MLTALMTGAAAAQTANSNTSPNPPAVATGNANSKTSAAPVAGANSFTESEARSRIEASGYSSVNGLTKDNQGIWRGHATKDGASLAVALDYQGNVTAQ
jgi:putative membrane protein